MFLFPKFPVIKNLHYPNLRSKNSFSASLVFIFFLNTPRETSVFITSNIKFHNNTPWYLKLGDGTDVVVGWIGWWYWCGGWLDWVMVLMRWLDALGDGTDVMDGSIRWWYWCGGWLDWVMVLMWWLVELGDGTDVVVGCIGGTDVVVGWIGWWY